MFFKKTVIELNGTTPSQNKLCFNTLHKVKFENSCTDIDFDEMELMDGSKHTEQVKRTISINFLYWMSSLPQILTNGAH